MRCIYYLLPYNGGGGGGLVTQSGLTLSIQRTAALQAPLSIGFPGQEFWSGLPLPSPAAA